MMWLGLFFVGCAESEKEIEQMRYECEEDGVMNNFYIYLSFPNPKTIKNLRINRIRNGKNIETFDLKPSGASIFVEKNIYTHDSYQFIVDDGKPFLLTDVKTKFNIHCPMLFGKCRKSCGIDTGKMNGEAYDRIDGIFLQKEGYKGE